MPVSDEPSDEGQDCLSTVESEVVLVGELVGHDDGRDVRSTVESAVGSEVGLPGTRCVEDCDGFEVGLGVLSVVGSE